MKNKPIAISFIVSAYNRPRFLVACLASLQLQTEHYEIIVCINATEQHMIKPHIEVCKRFGVAYILTGKLGAPNSYFSSEMAIGRTHGEFLCFPSDDSQYFPCFSDLMIRAAREHNYDLVYCDMVYDPMRLVQRQGRYGVLRTKPVVGHIDKTNFIVKRAWFTGWPGKRIEGGSPSDGLLAEDLVRRGARHGKPGDSILAVHN